MTLLEVLVATLVVGLVITSAGLALGASTSAAAALAEEPIDAALLAREAYELALAQDTADDGDPPATDASGVAGLDSLDGASFSPPLGAGGTVLELDFGELWRQDLDVSVYDLGDLSSPVSASFSGTTPGATTLYRLEVTVSFRGVAKGTWWWWLEP